MATTPQNPPPRHPATPPQTRPNQPQGTAQHRDDDKDKAPEPTQQSDDTRPPLPTGKDYVAGQPVTQEEYDRTEAEAAARRAANAPKEDTTAHADEGKNPHKDL